MKKLALVGGKIVTPFRVVKNGAILIQDDRIYEIGNTNEINFGEDTEIIDVSGCIIAPGFVDLLVHGGAGRGFSDEDEDSIQIISDYFLSQGSTTIDGKFTCKTKGTTFK